VVETSPYSPSSRKADIENLQWCVMADEYGDALERLGQNEKAERVRGLAGRAYEEIREGVYVPHTFRVAVGRKAGEV
jgi:hypothetical protein